MSEARVDPSYYKNGKSPGLTHATFRVIEELRAHERTFGEFPDRFESNAPPVAVAMAVDMYMKMRLRDTTEPAGGRSGQKINHRRTSRPSSGVRVGAGDGK